VKDHKFRSVSRRVKSGGGDVGFLDPLGAGGGGGGGSYLGPRRGRHEQGGRRRGRARLRRVSTMACAGGEGFLSAPFVSLPPPSSEREEFFRLSRVFFLPTEMVLLSFFGVNERRGSGGASYKIYVISASCCRAVV
jgi:hypothetical protein